MNRKKAKKILFICEGNVGRSQIAEGFYNYYTQTHYGKSAGINNVGEKYNYIPREDIIKVMLEKKIDISSQRIKHVNKSHLNQIDEIVVLCSPDKLPAFIKESKIDIVYKEVVDPYNSSYNSLLEIRDKIEEIVLEIL